jgi:hypothetical protein
MKQMKKQGGKTKFDKEGMVSVWVSQVPYADIPDDYFDEREKGHIPLNEWAGNFKFNTFNSDNIEINGAYDGTVTIKRAAGECSYSTSYIDALVAKAKKLDLVNITWIILLFDFEYYPKKTGVSKDQYVNFIGSYPYNSDADNLYSINQETGEKRLKLNLMP